MQSERFYQALKGHGGTARLVLLPHESHGYSARESIMHVRGAGRGGRGAECRRGQAGAGGASWRLCRVPLRPRVDGPAAGGR